MTAPDPSVWFPEFYSNAAIQTLANSPRWTISGQLGDLERDPDEKIATRKAPIDVRHLIDGCSPSCRHDGPIRGAWATDESCLVTLTELTREIPGAANAAYYVQAQTDGALVLDIEATCPPEIALQLLRLPGVLYSEVSMSGRGFHLLMALPANFHEFPIATTKRKLQDENNHYELLLDHFSTFTRTPIPASITDAVEALAGPLLYPTIEDLYADLAGRAKKSALGSAVTVETSLDDSEIPYAIDIVTATVKAARGHLKSLEYFNHDHSRYEFSVLGSLYGWLRTAVTQYEKVGVDYSSGDLAFLLYQATTQIVEPRSKHEQIRNGRPFLLDRAASLIADRVAAASRRQQS